jgi:hypothetical protein
VGVGIGSGIGTRLVGWVGELWLIVLRLLLEGEERRRRRSIHLRLGRPVRRGCLLVGVGVGVVWRLLLLLAIGVGRLRELPVRRGGREEGLLLGQGLVRGWGLGELVLALGWNKGRVLERQGRWVLRSQGRSSEGRTLDGVRVDREPLLLHRHRLDRRRGRGLLRDHWQLSDRR